MTVPGHPRAQEDELEPGQETMEVGEWREGCLGSQMKRMF